MFIKIFVLLVSLSINFNAKADLQQKFTLIGGKTSSIKKHMQPGQWTVIVIWSNSCFFCNKNIDGYKKLHKNSNNINVIGLSVDTSLREAKKFVVRHQLPFVNLVGSPVDAGVLYLTEAGKNFKYTPSYLLYGPNGKIVVEQSGSVDAKIILDFINSKGNINY